MSIESLRWALDIGEELKLEPVQRHILFILGNRADEQGYLYPSISWVSKRTGLSKRTVQEHVAALEARGLFKRSPRRQEDGGRTSDEWWLAMKQPGLALDPPPHAPAARGGAQKAPGGVVRPVHPPHAPAAPNTQEDTQDTKPSEQRQKPVDKSKPKAESPHVQEMRKAMEKAKHRQQTPKTQPEVPA